MVLGEKECVELLGFYRVDILFEYFFVLFYESCLVDDLLVNNIQLFFIGFDLIIDLIQLNALILGSSIITCK